MAISLVSPERNRGAAGHGEGRRSRLRQRRAWLWRLPHRPRLGRDHQPDRGRLGSVRRRAVPAGGEPGVALRRGRARPLDAAGHERRQACQAQLLHARRLAGRPADALCAHGHGGGDGDLHRAQLPLREAARTDHPRRPDRARRPDPAARLPGLRERPPVGGQDPRSGRGRARGARRPLLGRGALLPLHADPPLGRHREALSLDSRVLGQLRLATGRSRRRRQAGVLGLRRALRLRVHRLRVLVRADPDLELPSGQARGRHAQVPGTHPEERGDQSRVLPQGPRRPRTRTSGRTSPPTSPTSTCSGIRPKGSACSISP